MECYIYGKTLSIQKVEAGMSARGSSSMKLFILFCCLALAGKINFSAFDRPCFLNAGMISFGEVRGGGEVY